MRGVTDNRQFSPLMQLNQVLAANSVVILTTGCLRDTICLLMQEAFMEHLPELCLEGAFGYFLGDI